MKIKFLFLFLFITNFLFSQSDIYYFNDQGNKLSLEEVMQEDFEFLENDILKPYSDDVHWFKIPASSSTEDYIARIEYDRIRNAKAYQKGIELKSLPKERYLSFKFDRSDDVYISVNPSLHSFIPISLNTEKQAEIRNHNQLLLNGFYYGFAVVVIVYSLFYFFVFKDDSFLYYAFLLGSVSFGLFIMDGMLNYYELSPPLNDFLNIMNYVVLAVSSSMFANSYLFLDTYFPNHKKLSHSLIAGTALMVVLYLIFKNYYFILLVNIFVFTILLSYWIYAVLLFRKNMYTKFLVFADVIILFSAIDFFILKFLGISIGNIDPISIKIGAFLEMILLSIAVLYRLNALKLQYRKMRNDIIKFSNKLQSEDIALNPLDLLSAREREIFDLIVNINTNKEIALTLNISVNTVKFHIKNIYEKLEINSRKEALSLAKTSKNKRSTLITTP